MAAKKILGIIFSNAYDEVLPELTNLRTMGSVPFAGRYRLIDFPLSNMVNAGISRVGVVTSSNYRSLMDHIGNGKPWDLARKREGLNLLPPFTQTESHTFKGKIEALYGSMGYITDSGKDYVLLADCNVISGVDYSEMIEYHDEKNADITIACVNVVPPQLDLGTEIVLDETGRVTGFKSVSSFDKPVNYSLKLMLIRRTVLERFLVEGRSRKIAHFEDILPENISNLRIFGYKQQGYAKVIYSLQSYYEASMDLLRPEVRKSLFTQDSPVYTKTSDTVPTYYGINAKVSDTLFADGCKIEGEIENCILFRGVKVGKGAVVKNSIIMQDTVIGENANVEYVITDKDVVIGSNQKLSGALNYPLYIGKGIVI